MYTYKFRFIECVTHIIICNPNNDLFTLFDFICTDKRSVPIHKHLYCVHHFLNFLMCPEIEFNENVLPPPHNHLLYTSKLYRETQATGAVVLRERQSHIVARYWKNHGSDRGSILRKRKRRRRNNNQKSCDSSVESKPC